MTAKVVYRENSSRNVVRVDDHGHFRIRLGACGNALHIAKMDGTKLTAIPKHDSRLEPIDADDLELIEAVVTAIHVTEHLGKIKETDQTVEEVQHEWTQRAYNPA